MKNSAYRVYCLYKRIDFVFNRSNYDLFYTIEQPVVRKIYDAQPRYIKDNCYRIFNELESNWYTFDDLLCYWMYRSLWDKKGTFDTKGIDAFKLTFNEKQLEKDRRLISEINKTVKLKSISEYFELKENGESLAYQLAMNNQISIYFCIIYLTSFLKRDILNKEYKKFIETIKLIASRKGCG